MKTPVADVLRDKGHDVYAIAPDATLYEAVKLMAERHAGCLLVRNAAGKVVGILSERDYREAILQEKSLHQVLVRDAMTRKVLHVTPERTIDECMQLMTQHRVRHLPVMVGAEVQGLISIGDLVKFICSERGLEIENLEKYITGSL